MIAALGATSTILILVAVLLLDIAVQGTNLLSQTRLLSIDPAARSRLNTAFVASNFVGGAIGSGITGILWEVGGWHLVMAGAGVLVAIALGIWLTQRKYLAVARA